ncbi:MAG: twin-arginine translocase TatA/TatE family subunit [Gemmatimonadaceae bacterium]|nr:twin-arginine translocase TatA/TatE family subunit [Gemmatimonadaceae bacterium]
MGNIGMPEILLIMLIVLLLFGARRIPEIAGSIGKGIREFKKNINDATRDVQDGIHDRPRLTEAELEARRASEAAKDTASTSEPKRLL